MPNSHNLGTSSTAYSRRRSQGIKGEIPLTHNRKCSWPLQDVGAALCFQPQLDDNTEGLEDLIERLSRSQNILGHMETVWMRSNHNAYALH